MKYTIDYRVYVDTSSEDEALEEAQRIWDEVLLPAVKGTGVMMIPVASVKEHKFL